MGKIFLYPLGILFISVTKIRRKIYEWGLLKQRRLPRPAVSTGNLNMGGSGKTPLTMFLANHLMEKGIKPAILLRGYGRKTKGALLVKASSTADEVGEEALLYKRNLDIEVAVAEKREEALKVLPTLPDIFLLDDAFQHFRVFRDADIIVVDASKPKDLRPLPFGKLREPLSSADRASLVAITRGKKEDLPAQFRKMVESRPCVTVSFQWREKLYPDGIFLGEAPDRKYFLLLGIGNPDNFKRMAEERGLKITGEKILPDHAFPNPQLINEINEAAAGCDYIITSEKDFVKWSKAEGLKIHLAYPKLKLAVADPDGSLDKLLRELLS